MDGLMGRYDPSVAPDPVEWLETDESDRIAIVEEFHVAAGEKLEEGSDKLHAVIHVVVENQIALDMDPVPAVVKKLMRQGLDRHDAIHAIGAVLSGGNFDILQGEVGSHDPEKYRKRLKKLSAKRWREGRW